MSRERTGSLVEFRDERGRLRFRVSITLADGTRRFKRLPPGTTEERAKATRDSWNEKAATDPAFFDPQDAPAGETVKDYAGRWIEARDAKGNTSIRDDRNRLSKWLYPRLGERTIGSVTKQDIKDLVEMLDARVAAKDIGAKTAANIWGVVRKLFDDSANSKVRALCVRDANPAAGVRGPDRGIEKSRTFLYPAELVAFVVCPTIPQRWRRLVALAVFTYMRPGELEALQWSDVDLVHGTIHVHRAIDRYRGQVKATKTSVPRRIPIEPNLYPLLEVMHRESGGKGSVLDMPQVDDLAQFLRKYLKRAGVERGELFADDDTRKNIRFYDLRASGIEWRAVRGDQPLQIKRDAGHKRFSTTEIYLREADTIRTGFGDVFPALPESLLKPESCRESCRSEGPIVSTTRPESRNDGGAEGNRSRRDGDSRPESSGIVDAEPPRGSDDPGHKSATVGRQHDSGANEPTVESTASAPVSLVDPIELALADAITKASAEGRWETVTALAGEAQARRLARAGSNVVALPPARRRGGS